MKQINFYIMTMFILYNIRIVITDPHLESLISITSDNYHPIKEGHCAKIIDHKHPDLVTPIYPAPICRFPSLPSNNPQSQKTVPITTFKYTPGKLHEHLFLVKMYQTMEKCWVSWYLSTKKRQWGETLIKASIHMEKEQLLKIKNSYNEILNNINYKVYLTDEVCNFWSEKEIQRTVVVFERLIASEKIDFSGNVIGCTSQCSILTQGMCLCNDYAMFTTETGLSNWVKGNNTYQNENTCLMSYHKFRNMSLFPVSGKPTYHQLISQDGEISLVYDSSNVKSVLCKIDEKKQVIFISEEGLPFYMVLNNNRSLSSRDWRTYIDAYTLQTASLYSHVESLVFKTQISNYYEMQKLQYQVCKNRAQIWRHSISKILVNPSLMASYISDDPNAEGVFSSNLLSIYLPTNFPPEWKLEINYHRCNGLYYDCRIITGKGSSKASCETSTGKIHLVDNMEYIDNCTNFILPLCNGSFLILPSGKLNNIPYSFLGDHFSSFIIESKDMLTEDPEVSVMLSSINEDIFLNNMYNEPDSSSFSLNSPLSIFQWVQNNIMSIITFGEILVILFLSSFLLKGLILIYKVIYY